MRIVSAALLLAMAGSIAVIAFELREGADPDRPASAKTAPSAKIAEPPALPELALGPLSGMDRTAARPLFRYDRRPPAIAPVVKAPKAPERAKAPKAPKALKKTKAAKPLSAPVPEPVPRFRHTLSAIVIAEGEAFAYLRKAGEAGLARMRRGETLDGWQLEEVRPDAVVLTFGKTRTELELRPSEPSAGPGTPLSTGPKTPPSAGRGLRLRGKDSPLAGPRKPGPRDGKVKAWKIRPNAAEAGSAPPSSRRPKRGPRGGSLERALRRTERSSGTNR